VDVVEAVVDLFCDAAVSFLLACSAYEVAIIKQQKNITKHIIFFILSFSLL